MPPNGSGDERVLISGGGIGGLAAAVALKQKGHRVLVVERRQDAEAQKVGAAIALWGNAWRALDALGVADGLREKYPPLERIQLCAPDRVLREFDLNEECDGGPHEFRGVRRGDLLQALQSKLDPETEICYGVQVTKAEVRDEKKGHAGVEACMQRDGTSDVSTARFLACVAADGINSPVARGCLTLRSPSYSGYAAFRGVGALDPSTSASDRTVRQVLGRGVRAGTYPLGDGQVYWFVCFNAKEDEGGPEPGGPSSQALALARVPDWGHGVRDAIAATPSDAISFSRIRDRWDLPSDTFGVGHVTACGDAMHPMTPNLGQGGCCALEDAVVLGSAFRGNEGLATCEKSLRAYERERLKRTMPLTVRANLMGQALQISNPLVCAVRDAVIERVFSPAHFLDHTLYDPREGGAFVDNFMKIGREGA